MRVNIQELLEGCILSEDVYSMTNRPIFRKNTVVTNDVIQILKAFLVQQVTINKTMVNGSSFTASESKDSTVADKSVNDLENDLLHMFLSGVQSYKKEFKTWQSGLPINISNIRNIILPLIEKVEEQPSNIFSLHHLSIDQEYMYQHSVAVGIFCAFIGKKLKMLKGEIVQLALGGCLADAGMSKIKPGILINSSSLTLEEFKEIKMHPLDSYNMIKNIPILRESIKVGILQHHERLDGSGYPFGKKSGEINLTARIIAVADSFHAMTSKRLYRQKQSPFRVLEMLLQDSFGKYDMNVVKTLGVGIITFSIGSNVKLSNGQIAEILFIDERTPTRPLIKLIENGDIIHLEKSRNLYIEEVLK